MPIVVVLCMKCGKNKAFAGCYQPIQSLSLWKHHLCFRIVDLMSISWKLAHGKARWSGKLHFTQMFNHRYNCQAVSWFRSWTEFSAMWPGTFDTFCRSRNNFRFGKCRQFAWIYLLVFFFRSNFKYIKPGIKYLCEENSVCEPAWWIELNSTCRKLWSNSKKLQMFAEDWLCQVCRVNMAKAKVQQELSSLNNAYDCMRTKQQLMVKMNLPDFGKCYSRPDCHGFHNETQLSLILWFS